MKLISRLLVISCLAICGIANAGSINGVKIIDIRIDSTGKGIIYLSSNISGSPTCSTFPASMSFNTNTDGGRAIYSAAMSAYLANKTVEVIGTNSCSIYAGAVEDLATIYLK